jgi:hypothetical chaperone protein
MSSAPPVASIGIDFGTSNTVIALAAPDGQVEAVRFTHAGTSEDIFASALCFWPERPGSGLPPNAEGGPWAIERLLQGHGALRFMQSFKTFAASASFQTTTVFGQRYGFEDLLAAFLRSLIRHGDRELKLDEARIVIGRPVRFAGNDPDDDLAMQRYRDAFGRLGFDNALFVYEPVGAAFSFARRLESGATVLVADFGGGTSDFSVMRFSRQSGVLRSEPLGQAGIGIAGDNFDYRIVDRIVAPRLGKGSEFRSFGKLLPVPNRYYARLARWNELAMMKGSSDLGELRRLVRDAIEPGALEDFISIVEFDLGFALYRAVAAAKVALSSEQEAVFRFHEDGIDIDATITRKAFESWIAEDLANIGGAVDEAIKTAGITAGDVDRVFLTGGTSFVPAVQRLFADRFGADKLISGDQFVSIAHGLALIGQSADPGQWIAAA